MSDEIDDGGTAFPIPSGEYNKTEYGMSLRDWFAGQAMSGNIAAYAGMDVALPKADDVAANAYAYADAMLRARKAGGQ